MQEGQYAQYPRPPKGEIDFGVISEAFQMVIKNPVPMMAASFFGYFLPLCITYAVTIYVEFQLGFFSPVANQDPMVELEKMGKLYAVQFPMLIGQGIILAPFGYAITVMTLKLVRGESITFKDAFCGFPKFFQSLGGVVLPYILTTLAIVACCIGAPIVGGLLMLTLPMMIDQNMSIGQAMSTSFAKLRPHIWMAMLLFICYAILSTLGAMACLVGAIFTFPLYFIVPALVYRDFTAGTVQVQAPRSDFNES